MWPFSISPKAVSRGRRSRNIDAYAAAGRGSDRSRRQVFYIAGCDLRLQIDLIWRCPWHRLRTIMHEVKIMRKRQSKKQWLWEFSKKIVVMVAVVYAAVILHDRIFLWIYPESTAMTVMSEQISDVFKITVVAYAVKAGFENVCKIRKYDEEEEV